MKIISVERIPPGMGGEIRVRFNDARPLICRRSDLLSYERFQETVWRKLGRVYTCTLAEEPGSGTWNWRSMVESWLTEAEITSNESQDGS